MFGLIIFINQFSSLNFRHSSLITLKYYIRLAPSLSYRYSIFFTLFVSPIPVTRCSFLFSFSFFFSVLKNLNQKGKKKKNTRRHLRSLNPGEERKKKKRKRKTLEIIEPRRRKKKRKRKKEDTYDHRTEEKKEKKRRKEDTEITEPRRRKKKEKEKK